MFFINLNILQSDAESLSFETVCVVMESGKFSSSRSHYPERASDFKDAVAPRFDHSDVVFCLF